MKKITCVLLALCIAATLFSAVACGDNYGEYEETPGGSLDLDTDDSPSTAPSDPEDDAYINAAPANSEKGWGELAPRK